MLQIGDLGGTTGSIFGDVLNNGSLIFSRSDAYAVVNTISGTGTVTIQDGGIATADRQQQLHGRFAGSSGSLGSPPQGSTLIADANSNLGSPTGNIILDAGSKLVLANSSRSPAQSCLNGSVPVTIDTQENTVTASGVLSGPVPLAKDGIGTLILTNTNSQTGGAAINAGTLQIGSGVGTGTLNGDVTIAVGARLVFDRADAMTFGGITGAGSRTAFGNVDQRRRLRGPDGNRHADRCRRSHLFGRNHASRADGCWSTARSSGPPTWRAARGWAARAASAAR